MSLSRTRTSGGSNPSCFAIMGKHSATSHIQSLAGCFVASVISTFLPADMHEYKRGISRLNPLDVSTFLVKKSQDQSVDAWRLRNWSHVGSARSGSGSTPCSLRIDRMVDFEMDLIPRFWSSPNIRAYPQLGVLAIWSTSFLRFFLIGGRPGLFALDFVLAFLLRIHLWNVVY